MTGRIPQCYVTCMLLGLTISILAMTAIIALRYIASSGGFALLTRRVRPGIYARKNQQIRSEIAWSLASAAIYGLPAGIIAWGWANQGWTRIYLVIDQHPIWWWPISILLYLAIHDCWFYWTHRALHTPWLFRRFHAVHHASRSPTAWTAMSFHPGEAISGAVVIPLLVLLIPIHISALGVVLAIMTIMGVTNHMGWEIFPRLLVRGQIGKWLITASHHHRHHHDYHCNFGLYFRFWDRLANTDRGLAVFDRHLASPVKL